MAWYWILLIIIAAGVGPFEAMYTYNKARQKKEERRKREEESKQRK